LKKRYCELNFPYFIALKARLLGEKSKKSAFPWENLSTAFLGHPRAKILPLGLSDPYFRSVFTNTSKKLKSDIRRLLSNYYENSMKTLFC
jgi:hypothetical protein